MACRHYSYGYSRKQWPQKSVTGTNTIRVIAEAECPVISVQAHANKMGFNNIVLPIDDSAHSRHKVPMCVAMANIYQSKVHILAFKPKKDVEDSHRKFVVRIEQVEDFLTEHNLISETHYTTEGNQGDDTINFAKSIEADLIVMMTEQEFSITGTSLGTFANTVINRSPIAVLSVQPQESNPDNISVGY
ncbi:MAG: universal stress protein [Bacteroidetes bacterium]|nr:universal stress protein [Bacteroidota bacterium]